MGPHVKCMGKIPIMSQQPKEKKWTFPIYYFSTFKVRNRLKLGSGGVKLVQDYKGVCIFLSD